MTMKVLTKTEDRTGYECVCLWVCVCVCVFTDRERFDLLQDAMSVVCGSEMRVFHRVNIVYSSECAGARRRPRHTLTTPGMRVLLTVLLLWLLPAHTGVCVCVCGCVV